MPSARQSLLAAALLLTLALGTRWLAEAFPPSEVVPSGSGSSETRLRATSTGAPAESRCPPGTLEDDGACVPVPAGVR